MGKDRFEINSQIYSGVSAAFIIDALIVVAFGFGAYSVMQSLITAGAVALFALIAVCSMSLRLIPEWNRKAVLRLGNYKGIAGPGLFAIVPIIDSTPITLDLRVINSTFSAAQTLTMDNVPVDVDALLFWHVKDPEKAILNVQDYYTSVQLAAQTALRDVIGKNDLSKLLAGRDIIGEDIKRLIEDRILEWGMEAISVEVRDVKIPEELQNAMARVATSEREKMARVMLAESESLAADKMLEASSKYQKDATAMQLRALNMMYEISMNGKNLMIFIPTENGGMSMPMPMGVMGLEAAQKVQQEKTKKQDKKDERK